MISDPFTAFGLPSVLLWTTELERQYLQDEAWNHETHWDRYVERLEALERPSEAQHRERLIVRCVRGEVSAALDDLEQLPEAHGLEHLARVRLRACLAAEQGDSAHALALLEQASAMHDDPSLPWPTSYSRDMSQRDTLLDWQVQLETDPNAYQAMHERRTALEVWFANPLIDTFALMSERAFTDHALEMLDLEEGTLHIRGGLQKEITAYYAALACAFAVGSLYQVRTLRRSFARNFGVQTAQNNDSELLEAAVVEHLLARDSDGLGKLLRRNAERLARVPGLEEHALNYGPRVAEGREAAQMFHTHLVYLAGVGDLLDDAVVEQLRAAFREALDSSPPTLEPEVAGGEGQFLLRLSQHPRLGKPLVAAWEALGPSTREDLEALLSLLEESAPHLESYPFFSLLARHHWSEHDQPLAAHLADVLLRQPLDDPFYSHSRVALLQQLSGAYIGSTLEAKIDLFVLGALERHPAWQWYFLDRRHPVFVARAEGEAEAMLATIELQASKSPHEVPFDAGRLIRHLHTLRQHYPEALKPDLEGRLLEMLWRLTFLSTLDVDTKAAVLQSLALRGQDDPVPEAWRMSLGGTPPQALMAEPLRHEVFVGGQDQVRVRLWYSALRLFHLFPGEVPGDELRALVEALEHPSARVQREALNVLEGLAARGHPIEVLLPTLYGKLLREPMQTQAQALRTVLYDGVISNPIWGEALYAQVVRLVLEGGRYVRRTLIGRLEEKRYPLSSAQLARLVPLLEVLLDDPHRSVREAVRRLNVVQQPGVVG